MICSSLRAQTSDSEWPLFRGKADLSGRSESEFPSSPVLLWSISTGSRTKSSPVISGGVIYFGNEKGTITAVTTDGKPMWTYEGGSPVDAAPMVWGQKVIYGSSDGKVRAIDSRTGKLIWSYATENQIAGSANIWKVKNQSGIVIGSYDYFLHCISPETGKLLWKVETENYINGTPSILNGKVVFGGCDGMIRVVDPLTGRQTDTIDIGVYIASSPALSGNMAYFGDYNGNKYCVNLNSRKVVWKIPSAEESGAILGIPAVGPSSIVLGSEDKYIYCLDSKNGNLNWKFRTNGKIISSAVVSNSKVLATGMDGFIYMLDLESGKKLWSFNAGSPVSSSPAVTGERFYILTEDGRLMAFAAKNNNKK